MNATFKESMTELNKSLLSVVTRGNFSKYNKFKESLSGRHDKLMNEVHYAKRRNSIHHKSPHVGLGTLKSSEDEDHSSSSDASLQTDSGLEEELKDDFEY